jgi:uncharacterized protein
MMTIQTAVRPSPIHGLGCFTVHDIAQGQVVWEFLPEVDRRYTLQQLSQLPPLVIAYFRTYAWMNPTDRFILFSGDNSKFFNHSDSANTSMSGNGYQCVAKRAIAAGEELTSNYAELLDVPEV